MILTANGVQFSAHFKHVRSTTMDPEARGFTYCTLHPGICEHQKGHPCPVTSRLMLAQQHLTAGQSALAQWAAAASAALGMVAAPPPAEPPALDCSALLTDSYKIPQSDRDSVTAQARCSYRDDFRPATGRKVALARAMRGLGLDRGTRRQLWASYFQRVGAPA